LDLPEHGDRRNPGAAEIIGTNLLPRAFGLHMPAALWTAPAFDRCMLLASIYPIWANPDAFMREVALARIYDGVHYRNSTEVGTAIGVKIGEFAAAK
jgi:hypothetical protein